MDIIDGHLDLAYNALELKRDITLPLATIRQLEGDIPAHTQGTATVSIPAIRDAGISLLFASIFVPPTRDGCQLSLQETDYAARAQLNYYHNLAAKGEISIIYNRRDLKALLKGITPQPGIVITMEGSEALLTPANLHEYYQSGVRIIGLAWRTTRYAAGCETDGPLTALGQELLKEMAQYGVVLDISHLAEQACWQAFASFPGRVVATHAAARKIVPLARLLSDDIIRAIADRDGVIGLACYNNFLQITNEKNHRISLDAMLQHIDHIVKIAGSTRNLGIGSDLDGGFGRENIPIELDSISDLPIITVKLLTHGYSYGDISAIMQDNWLRLLKKVLPV